jgi:hypothetical protein
LHKCLNVQYHQLQIIDLSRNQGNDVLLRQIHFLSLKLAYQESFHRLLSNENKQKVIYYHLVKKIPQIVGADIASMAIINAKKGTLRPDRTRVSFSLRLHNIKNDCNSVFIIRSTHKLHLKYFITFIFLSLYLPHIQQSCHFA